MEKFDGEEMSQCKTIMKANGPVSYYSSNGYTMRRDYTRRHDGFQFSGEWVLRDPNGSYVAHNQYRYDLAEEYELILQN
jgi:hypothetical protein